ncbi:GNAT family N-acetyltransferase [Candidatus Mycolicibacterium alkanivorans]|uniref:GNAT family N-acetyltransferase n=1 Tax=Candidatus Mycolicibacterium alkanivorans TaxID=2954114 RepID=A0ABS9YYD6_9MYCO|nr:GNAT family N-acetyltransferase [Candidatus Mycolicibacterium alkanivorans]MCI4676112.1 GNAT family N-acetyltransferase [Candidatus Mycolicibacterium alkanivorans]
MPSTGSPQARVTRLTESDWEQFAHLRLRALSDAFGTADEQYLTESRFSATSWQQRLRDHAQFALFVTGAAWPATSDTGAAWPATSDTGAAWPAGLVAAHRESPDNVYLYSLWIDPRVRGRGLARRLVGAALDWARRGGVRTVTLRMAPDNRIARSLYEGFGFVEVPGPGTAEVPMRLSLG